MKKISICKELSDACKGIKLGCIQYTAVVEKSNKDLLKKLDDVCSVIEKDFSIENIGNEPNIEAARNLYKRIGKDPYRYRISSEALMRRIVQGKGIYHINNVVDCNNLISLETKLSVGSYDIDNLGNNLEFRVGNNGESYRGIGKETINVAKLPVFADEDGAYGSPTSDSEKAMITPKTNTVLTVLISFNKDFNMENELNKAVQNIKEYVKATDIETQIVEGC